ncbi:PPOX class F420-dependent oxidoreductase [Cryptosporangium phraense]|uniref:PPOX class F420-dependent oxidoreductase n=1 Tax=Cryptosporangium phraense TaxID=2593070 RepID=A0A545AJ56_9ACTN|nr:PPOX class F420-dependent oxidoreductase [Cryptosporangium phraense]TQS41348.1 PPOX class F420-dependent oxidoreductase [Cryptosporangium phraense]
MSVADEIGRGRYVSLTTYKKDGTPVATPVWHAYVDGVVYVISEASAWKVKRIRNNPAVQLTVCGIRGRIAPDAPTASGTAQLLDESEEPRVRRYIAKKYWMSRIANTATAVFRIKRPPVTCIAITIP